MTEYVEKRMTGIYPNPLTFERFERPTEKAELPL